MDHNSNINGKIEAEMFFVNIFEKNINWWIIDSGDNDMCVSP